jgi:NADH:ubiquinone oxidoreductase subunit F (NADH-binding)
MTVPHVREDSAARSPESRKGFARIGDKHARLLGGPDSSWNQETFQAHEARVGRLDLSRPPEELRRVIAESGIVGRGGGEFPLARKLDSAVHAAGEPIVVVNASEGEPASKKDMTLLRTRTHLVLDGADVVAASIGASEIVVYLHATREHLRQRITAAILEREAAGRLERVVSIAEAPDRSVSGESSAVVSLLEHGVALPTRTTVPLAVGEVEGRPTIVSNAETYAHVGLIARLGAMWFRTAGTTGTPGSTLVTIAGAVRASGTVVEILHPLTFGELLKEVVGLEDPPQALLLGGYAGTWVNGASAWNTLIDRHALREVAAPIGCGLIAVLDYQACGLAETARLLEWMANESSGQCGSCATGLAAVAELMQLLCQGHAHTRDVERLRQLAVEIRGRGACAHPTGAIELLESALDTFDDEVRWHLRGHRCAAFGVGLPIHSIAD